MMAIARNEPAQSWRNFAAWSAVGAAFYSLALLVAISLLSRDGAGATFEMMFRSRQLAAILGLGLIFSTAMTGFTNLKRSVSGRTLRNFLIRDGVAMAVFLLAVWGVTRSARAGILDAMGTSERVAGATGLVLMLVAFLGILVLASTRTGADLVDDIEAAEDMRERGRLFLCSFAWIALCGLLLVVLSLAGPGNLLSPPAALAGTLALVALLAVLGIAAWRLSDELGRTLSYETGNMAFYLIWVLGSGWAMLAHLGFATAPALLDWLTLFTVLLFVATFIVLGRRKLLTR